MTNHTELVQRLGNMTADTNLSSRYAEAVSESIDALEQQAAQIEALRAEKADADATAASALRLVTDVRFALGDDGKRMQDELIEYARALRADAERMRGACQNARDIIVTDRQSFVDCQRLRDTRTESPIEHGLVWVDEDTWVTPDDAEALHDYDRALALIDAALRQEQPNE